MVQAILRSFLQYDYPSSDNVIAVRVPQYSGITMGGTLFPPALGMAVVVVFLAFMVSGTKPTWPWL